MFKLNFDMNFKYLPLNYKSIKSTLVNLIPNSEGETKYVQFTSLR